MNRKEIQELVEEVERKEAADFEDVNHYIFLHPELGLQEYLSAKYLVDFMERKGFTVTAPYADFETAFRAEYGTKGPLFAFLAEYDALPGYGKTRRTATPAVTTGSHRRRPAPRWSSRGWRINSGSESP